MPRHFDLRFLNAVKPKDRENVDITDRTPTSLPLVGVERGSVFARAKTRTSFVKLLSNNEELGSFPSQETRLKLKHKRGQTRLTHHLLELIGPPRALPRSRGGGGGISGSCGGGGRDSVGIGGGRHGDHPPLANNGRDARVVGAKLLLSSPPRKNVRHVAVQAKGRRHRNRGAEEHETAREIENTRQGW